MKINGNQIRLDKGDSLDFTFPSGSRINIEVTQDTAMIVLDNGQIIFSEDYNYGDLVGSPNQWIRNTPKTEDAVPKDWITLAVTQILNSGYIDSNDFTVGCARELYEIIDRNYPRK